MFRHAVVSMKRYWTGAHTKHRLLYRLVFIPKYRRRILRGKVPVRLRQLFKEACRINGWRITELSIQVDHVHMMIQVGPSESVAHIVQMLKGRSSRVIRKEFPELEEFLWGDSFWADGYFAETVGSAEESVVKRYIREQIGAGRSMPARS